MIIAQFNGNEKLKHFVLVTLFFTFLAIQGNAQEVEHNYLVGPQSTTCDSLKMYGLSKAQCIDQITDDNIPL